MLPPAVPGVVTDGAGRLTVSLAAGRRYRALVWRGEALLGQAFINSKATTLRLQELASLDGVLRSVEGRRLSDREVLVELPRIGHAYHERTDAQGAFRVRVPATEVRVVVGGAGGDQAVYPGPGERLSLDVVAREVEHASREEGPMASLAGTLLRPPHELMQGRLRLRGATLERPRWRALDADGGFEFRGVPEGRYTLDWVTARRGSFTLATPELSAQRATPCRLQLPQPGRLLVQLNHPDRLTFDLRRAGFQLAGTYLSDTETGWHHALYPEEIWIDEPSATLGIDDLFPGTYQLLVWNGLAELRTHFEVSEGGTTRLVVPDYEGNRVLVRVVAPHPLSGSDLRLHVLPDDAAPFDHMITRAPDPDDLGHVLVERLVLPPGGYAFEVTTPEGLRGRATWDGEAETLAVTLH